MILFPSTWQEALHFPSRAGEGLFFHSIVWPWNSWQGEFAEWCGCILSFRQLNVSSPVATLAASPWRWEAARVASHSAKSQAALGKQGTRRISVCELHMHTDSFLSDIHFSLQMARSSKKKSLQTDICNLRWWNQKWGKRKRSRERPVWALSSPDQCRDALHNRFLLDLCSNQFLCILQGILICSPKRLFFWACFVILSLGQTLLLLFPLSPSSQMTNAVLQLVLSHNLFIGVNAIFISHLFLSDAKSLASTSTCMYKFNETLVGVLKNIIWQTRCGLIAYNTIHMTKLKKKTMCWLTPQLPVVSNSFNRGNILKPHTVVLFQCRSQISIVSHLRDSILTNRVCPLYGANGQTASWAGKCWARA